MKAAFVEGSQKKYVMFRGFKFTKEPWIGTRPTDKNEIYDCSFNVHGVSEYPCSDACQAALLLNPEGVLLPSSHNKHFHDPAKNVSYLFFFLKRNYFLIFQVDSIPDRPTPVRANLNRIVAIGTKKRYQHMEKIEKFLDEKMLETVGIK